MNQFNMLKWQPAGTAPLYVQIADALHEAIRTDEATPGSRLPTQRALAAQLDVSVGTATSAYLEAERRGLVRRHVGRGRPAEPLADLQLGAQREGLQHAGDRVDEPVGAELSADVAEHQLRRAAVGADDAVDVVARLEAALPLWRQAHSRIGGLLGPELADGQEHTLHFKAKTPDGETRPVRLIDTAGMRKKAKVDDKLEKLSVADARRAVDFAEVVVLLLDATRGLASVRLTDPRVLRTANELTAQLWRGTGKLTLEQGPVDLRGVLQAAVDAVGPAIAAARFSAPASNSSAASSLAWAASSSAWEAMTFSPRAWRAFDAASTSCQRSAANRNTARARSARSFQAFPPSRTNTSLSTRTRRGPRYSCQRRRAVSSAAAAY